MSLSSFSKKCLYLHSPKKKKKKKLKKVLISIQSWIPLLPLFSVLYCFSLKVSYFIIQLLKKKVFFIIFSDSVVDKCLGVLRKCKS